MSNRTAKQVSQKRAGQKAAATRRRNRLIQLANKLGKTRTAAAHKAHLTMEHRKIDQMTETQLFS